MSKTAYFNDVGFPVEGLGLSTGKKGRGGAPKWLLVWYSRGGVGETFGTGGAEKGPSVYSAPQKGNEKGEKCLTCLSAAHKGRGPKAGEPKHGEYSR